MNNLEEILNHLYKVEGGALHRNPTEADVTSPRGLYKSQDSKSKIWEYYNSVAASLGITTNSKGWSAKQIVAINSKADANLILNYEREYYISYFKGLPIDITVLNPMLAVLISSLYANSPQGCIISLQEALIYLNKAGIISIPADKLSAPDGVVGNNTKYSMQAITNLDAKDLMIFSLLIIGRMQEYYINIAVETPGKYLVYLNGWKNRLREIKDTIF